MRYPETPGYQQGSSTSQAAAISMISNSRTKRAQIMREMEKTRLCGMTIDEAAVLLDCQTGSASARMRELELGGDIVKSTATRKTRFGKRAKVYYLQGAWK